MNALNAIALASLAALSSFGQGFVNLDFESGAIVPIVGDPFGRIQFGPAFPGWMAYYTSPSFSSTLSSTSPVLFNNLTLGTSALGLLDQNYSGGAAISNRTAMLQGGTGPSDVAVSLAQTGMVPAGSLSLQFMARTIRAEGFHVPETFIVSMNGQALPYYTLQSQGGIRLYGVDVSAFAGQMADLRFTQPNGSELFDNFALDNISFSPLAVPEPGTWALLGLGGALLGWGAWRRRK